MTGSTAAGATMTAVLRVLVVEDEPIAAEAHTAYVGRVDGFEVVGDGGHVAGGAEDVAGQGDRRRAARHEPARPARARRRARHACRRPPRRRHRRHVRARPRRRPRRRVARDRAVRPQALRLRDAARAAARLPRLPRPGDERRRDRHPGRGRRGLRRRPCRGRGAAARRGWARSCSPASHGCSARRTADRSASELGDELGVSRVTARRYAEYLCETRVVVRRSRYAGAGRPEVEYLWAR